MDLYGTRTTQIHPTQGENTQPHEDVLCFTGIMLRGGDFVHARECISYMHNDIIFSHKATKNSFSGLELSSTER